MAILPPIGTKVRVHLNLHNARHGGAAWVVTQGNKVMRDVNGDMMYVDTVALADVSAVYWRGNGKTGQSLSAAGGKRTVHAWLEGTIAALKSGPGTEITYNPYRCTSFTTRTGVPVTRAAFVRFDANRKAFALGEVR
jgi:hypothetical protein